MRLRMPTQTSAPLRRNAFLFSPQKAENQISKTRAEAEQTIFWECVFYLRKTLTFVDMYLHKQHTMWHNYYFTYANCILLTLIKRNAFGFNSKLFGNQAVKLPHPDTSQPNQTADNKGRRTGHVRGPVATTRQRPSTLGARPRPTCVSRTK